jgi:hypothetical protein
MLHALQNQEMKSHQLSLAYLLAHEVGSFRHQPDAACGRMLLLSNFSNAIVKKDHPALKI